MLSNSKYFKVDEWNPWTEKSKKISFKSHESSIGDGEHKLGFEFNTQPLGQNFKYDLNVFEEKWEIKKLDSDNSFRLGVEVSTFYTPIISTVIRILENTLKINNQLIKSEIEQKVRLCCQEIESKTGRCNHLLLDGLRKNEVAESNLDKANEIIEILKETMIDNNKKITLFSSIDGKSYDYNLLDSFKKITIEKISVQEKVKLLGNNDVYNRLLLTQTLFEDLKIFKEKSLRTLLNQTVRKVFHEVKLVLVHKDKGYKPIYNLESIYCNRITSGLPRCKLI